MMRSVPQQGMAGGVLLVALAYFVIQSAAFPFEMRPDEYKAVDTYVGWLSGDVVRSTEAFTRLLLLITNLSITFVLYRLRLINIQTLVIAALWPMTIFLFSKIYWEFFVFPFCLVRHDLTVRDELAFIGALAALLAMTGEANLAVLIMFRMVLVGQKGGFPILAPLAFAGAGVLISVAMDAGVGANLPFIGSHVARFSWTRDVVNPEYSVFETVAIFMTSFHFFTLHTGLWMIDAAFSILVVISILCFAGSFQRLRANWAPTLAFACVLCGLTEVTHAFQNARYFFFYLPLIASIAPPASWPIVGGLGIAHVVFKAAEAIWYG